MNLLANWLSPEAMRIVALTLLHFLWQGTALAAIAYAGISVLRSASARYAFSVGVLVAMLATPLATFFVLSGKAPAATSAASDSASAALGSARPSHARAVATESSSPSRSTAPDYLFFLVEFWFAGVVLFSLRSAGGFFLVERLRRKESTPVSRELLELCQALQQKMDIHKMVHYCESLQLSVPVVVGWIRPVVLLPVTALSGLSEEQLQAVIAHELAHIQRLDAFVNLFQIAVESLLFYHPAVWWLGKRIREERENCCDDAAVAVCGSPVIYAHALARLAESRVAPQLVMAANRGPLAARVARLLGIDKSSGGRRGADLSAGVLCLSATLLAGSALIGAAHIVRAQTPARPDPPVAPVAPAAPTAPLSAVPAAVAPRAPISGVSVKVPVSIHLPALPAAPAFALTMAIPVLPATPVVVVTPARAAAPQASPSPKAQSYIDGLKSAGLNDLTVDQLIGLKIQGVTPEYVKQIHDLGLKADADEIIGMKVQGITPEYVREMRAATGQTLDGGDLIGLKVQGVTPEYIKQLHDLGLKTNAGEIIGMKVQGVTPEYVKNINSLGLHPSADELIGMKVQGVDANYLKALQAAGFKVDIDEAIGAKVQGVTPEFIEKVHSHGFKDLSLEQLIALKRSGVLDGEK
jgi:bla regulator protein blaR1